MVTGEEVPKASTGEVLALTFASVLIVGVIASLTPQLINVIRYRSTVGISYLTLWLGNINSFMTALNTVILNSFKLYFCKQVGQIVCTRLSLLVTQLVVLWVMYFINYVVFLMFFTDEREEKRMKREALNPPIVHDLTFTMQYAESIQSHERTRKSKWRTNGGKKKIFGTVFYIGLIITLSCAALYLCLHFGVKDPKTVLFADVVGYFSSLLVIVQWAPQIWSTIKNKGSGSFSIIMILIMLPGSFTVLYFLAFVEHQSFSTWVSYLFAGIQQLVLFVLLLWYDYIRPRFAKRGTREEKTELLKGGAMVKSNLAVA